MFSSSSKSKMTGVHRVLALLQVASLVSAHPGHHRRANLLNESIALPIFHPHKHPFLNDIPIPNTPEELAAAKLPDYIHWAANNGFEPYGHGGKHNRTSLHRRFETAEHMSLGDALVLTGTDGADLAVPATFFLPNGLNLTYGEINGLGGDFYATYDPISDGADLAARVERFTAAYDLLATDTTRQPAEALALLAIGTDEKAAFAAAVTAGTDPSAAYEEMEDKSVDYELATITRPSDEPGYAGISAINWDHFGVDARTAYGAGHYAALTAAAGGDLLTAYAMNAFADHFLEDSFSAGHMRVPRRILHGSTNVPDLCAQYMHGEDNAIGLNVTNPNGDTWWAYGDNYLMDVADLDNLAHVHNALQVSVAEVLAAYTSGVAPTEADIDSFGAYAEMPILANLETTKNSSGGQTLAPLFTSDGWRRDAMDDRYSYKFTYSYTYATTLAQLKLSDDWDYPITMDS